VGYVRGVSSNRPAVSPRAAKRHLE